MPGFVVTRGLGPGATTTNLIARGFMPAIAEVVRGARITGRRAKQALESYIDELKISVALLAINGKDLVNPILNTVKASYSNEEKVTITAEPVKLAVKQPEIIVEAEVRRKNVLKD